MQNENQLINLGSNALNCIINYIDGCNEINFKFKQSIEEQNLKALEAEYEAQKRDLELNNLKNQLQKQKQCELEKIELIDIFINNLKSHYLLVREQQKELLSRIQKEHNIEKIKKLLLLNKTISKDINQRFYNLLNLMSIIH